MNWITIGIVVILGALWLISEVKNAPEMPDDYGREDYYGNSN